MNQQLLSFSMMACQFELSPHHQQQHSQMLYLML